MLIRDTALTEALVRWLRESNDDDRPALRVTERGSAIEVLRADGGELSPAEELEIKARLAAHAVEPLR